MDTAIHLSCNMYKNCTQLCYTVYTATYANLLYTWHFYISHCRQYVIYSYFNLTRASRVYTSHDCLPVAFFYSELEFTEWYIVFLTFVMLIFKITPHKQISLCQYYCQSLHAGKIARRLYPQNM